MQNDTGIADQKLSTRLGWMRFPDEGGCGRYSADLFYRFLADSGIVAGTPPTLPTYCVEEPEDEFRRGLKLGWSKWTYFARGLYTGRIKIGVSVHPHTRVRELINARYGEESELLVTLRGAHFERAYHEAFKDWLEGHEWFAPHPDILAEIDRLRRPACFCEPCAAPQ